MADLASDPSAPQRPSLNGINHLKLPSTNILETLDFYTTVLPMVHLPQYNHYTPQHKLFAVMFQHPSTGLLVEVRNAPEQAVQQKCFDPITWGVSLKKDLDDWALWLDHCSVKRSKVLTGIKGWVLCCEDPDGRQVRFYCDEEHEWTDFPDEDEYWLGSPKGIETDA